MATLTTSQNAGGGSTTTVLNSATGATEAQLITNADGSRITYEWLGLAADATLQMSGGVLTVAAGDVLGESYRLYRTALGRAPDAAGFNNLVNYLYTGGTMAAASAFMINNAEYSGRYGTPTASTFTGEMYWNSVGHGDPGGEAYFTNYLDSGGSRVNMVQWFSQGQESINYTTGAFADFLYTDNPSGFAFAARSFAADGHLLQDGFSYLNGDTQSDYYLANGQLQTEYFQHVSGNLNVISFDYSGTQWWSRYESDYSASGQWLGNVANVTGGGSIIQTYSQSTVDAWWQKIDWFDGANGSGAWTKEMIDHRDGTSATIDTNPYHTSPYAYKIDNYSGASGSGNCENGITVKADGSFSVWDTAASLSTLPGWAAVNAADADHTVAEVSDFASDGSLSKMSFMLDAGYVSMDLRTGIQTVAAVTPSAPGSPPSSGWAYALGALLELLEVPAAPAAVVIGIMRPSALGPDEDIKMQAFHDGVTAGRIEMGQNRTGPLGFGTGGSTQVTSPGSQGTGTYGSPERPSAPDFPTGAIGHN